MEGCSDDASSWRHAIRATEDKILEIHRLQEALISSEVRGCPSRASLPTEASPLEEIDYVLSLLRAQVAHTELVSKVNSLRQSAIRAGIPCETSPLVFSSTRDDIKAALVEQAVETFWRWVEGGTDPCAEALRDLVARMEEFRPKK